MAYFHVFKLIQHRYTLKKFEFLSEYKAVELYGGEFQRHKQHLTSNYALENVPLMANIADLFS